VEVEVEVGGEDDEGGEVVEGREDEK